MAYYDQTRTRSGIAGRLLTLVSQVNAWNDVRRTRNILHKLSAHELDDIGLSRGDIDRLG